MSEKKDILVLSSPDFGTGKETIGYYTGYACGYCHGNGWFWNPQIIHERVKILLSEMWRNRTCKRYRYSGMGSGRRGESLFQQKAGDMTPRIPIKYIVQIDNFHLGEFIFYWNYYGQPCPLLLQKPKTEGLTAIQAGGRQR